MSLSPGSRLGPYEVTAKIGQGGMGEVYRARDTKLGRDVALKVLPDLFADDPERLARFQREARVLASLNHPNIASIYGLEESGDTRALVLELVEGPTLAERIAQGAIPVDEALPIAKQIADALEAAHEAGVIHRDLKPANVKVRADGMVKVLDFGLAKALDPSPEGDPSESPTLTAAATQKGVIMGTAAYMSPEQASGSHVDKRADIWSFGVVLYEMLTGRRAFDGETVSHVLAAVLKTEPSWAALPSETPAAIHTLLRRCLAKERRRRVPDIGMARFEIDDVMAAPATEGTNAVAIPQRQLWQRPVPAVLAVLAALGLGGLAVWTLTRPDVIAVDLMRFVIVPPDTAPLSFVGFGHDLAISPDGSQVVYRGSVPGGGAPQLNLRPIDQLVGAPLRGGEGGVGPFFSPDGEWVGFVDSNNGTILRKVSIFGGPPVTLTESPNPIAGASWGTDDQIIFGSGTGLFRVSEGGGEPEALTTLDTEQGILGHGWPFIVPGAEAVLFMTAAGPPLTTGQLAVLDLDTGEVTRLGLAGVSPHYVSTGHLVYAAEDGSVRAVPFDATSLEVTGNPVPLIEGVMVKQTGAANFSISDNGRLVYALGAEVGGGPIRTMVWVDRVGLETALPLPARSCSDPRLSPDGSRVAVAVQDETRRDLWVFDVQSAARLRLTNEAAVLSPIWTPDAERIIFSWNKGPPFGLFWIPADGSGEAERLTTPDAGILGDFPTSVSPGGQAVLFTRILAADNQELWQVPLDGDRTPQPVVQGQFSRGNAALSPDGQWLAYRSNQSGVVEVYLQPYPGPGATTPVSIGGGDSVVWSRDGRELFYRLGNRMMVVEVETEPTLRVSPPEELWEEPHFEGGGIRQYHVAPDGRFLMIRQGSAPTAAAPAAPELVVVLNWFEELKERVPVP